MIVLLLCIYSLYFSYKIKLNLTSNSHHILRKSPPTTERPNYAQQHHAALENETVHSSQQDPQRRLPNALIIGVKKGGTRALLEFIRWHPDVRAADKEAHFFDKNYNYDKGLDWYRRKMPATIDGQITLEKTPDYFFIKEATKRVYDMNPKVKLLIVVRDPTTRAVSDYTQDLIQKKFKKKFVNFAFVNGNYSIVNTKWWPVWFGVSFSLKFVRVSLNSLIFSSSPF